MEKNFTESDCRAYMLQHALVHLWAAFIKNGSADNADQIDYISAHMRSELEQSRERATTEAQREFDTHVIRLEEEFWTAVRTVAGA